MVHTNEMKKLKRKIWLQTVVVIFSILFVFFIILNSVGIVAGNLFYKEFCVWHTRLDYKRFQSLQTTLDEGIRTKGWKNVTMESRLGYTLQGTYLPNPNPTKNTVVFVHGITGSRLMGLWYAPIYLGAGYNVLIYDSRASGESGGSSVSWGFFEKQDLDQWIDWIEEYHPGGNIGVHGVSMGAATALMHAEMNEATHRVTFYVADSGYSDLETLLTQKIDELAYLHDPLWVKILLGYSSFAANWQSGFHYRDVSPLRSVSNATTPILYFHGAADLLVPSYMEEQLYQATKGYKERYIFYGDAHAMAIFNHKAEYQQRIYAFMNQVVKNKNSLHK